MLHDSDGRFPSFPSPQPALQTLILETHNPRAKIATDLCRAQRSPNVFNCESLFRGITVPLTKHVGKRSPNL